MIFTPLDNLEGCLMIYTELIPNIKLNTAIMRKAAASGFSTATDLADHLVKAGTGFRDAHEIVGKAVAYCIREEKQFECLNAEDCALIDDRLTIKMMEKLSIQACVDARNHIGGTAPRQVRLQCKIWRKRLEK